jgi:hypothetical protein
MSHLKRTVYCTSGDISIVKVEPCGRERWVSWECINNRTGETRPTSEHTCLLTFNQMLIELNEAKP